MLEYIRVEGAEVREVGCGINHLQGEVFRGNGNGGGSEGNCVDQPAADDVHQNLVVGQEICTDDCRCG